MGLSGITRSAGISFRLTNERDRDLWIGLNNHTRNIPEEIVDELHGIVEGPYSRSERGRNLIAYGLVVEEAIEASGIDVDEVGSREELEVLVMEVLTEALVEYRRSEGAESCEVAPVR